MIDAAPNDPLSAGGLSRRRRAIPWIVAAAIVLSVVRYVPVIDDPWGTDPASGNGAWYSGQPVLNWIRLGFGNMRGMSMLGALPTKPPMGVLYAHHPPAFNWTVYAVVRAFGFTERSFRLLPVVMTALAGGMLVALACRFMGTVAGCVAGLLWLTLPMVWLYGVMCNPEAATLFAIVLVFWLHVRLQNRGAWAYVLALGAQFLAGQMDWEGHFAVPAVALYELMKPRGERRRLDRVVWLGVASLASAAVALVAQGFFIHAVTGGTDAAIGFPPFALLSIGTYLVEGVNGSMLTLGHVHEGSSAVGAGTFWSTQAQFLTAMFTWPGTLTLVAGIVLACARRTPGSALGLGLLVPGVLNAAIFRGHAIHHEYWLYYLAPGVVITVAEVVRSLARRRLVAIGLVAAILGASVWTDVREVGERRTTGFRDLAGELDRMIEHDDEILVCDVRLIPVTFYTRHWVVAEAQSPHAWEHVEGLARLRKAGGLDRPVTLLVVPTFDAPPPLADLAKYGRLEMLGPEEVARRLPTSNSIYRGPIWLLRLS